MAKVKRPSAIQSEVRLRNWPAGRVSQLKLFLGHLEQAVGISLAAQVEQSPKRKFSEFVPKIVPQDVTAEVEWREARVHFTAPRGLKNLLFYEFDISLTAGFFNLDRFASPETFYVFPSLANGTTYYIRMRVVTKNGEVGPWSDNVVLTTPLAQAFGIRDGREVVTRLNNKGTADNWKSLYERDYSAIGGKTYYAIDYDCSIFRKWGADGNVEWSDATFRWMEAPTFYPADSDYVQRGSEFHVTAYATNGSFSPSEFYLFSVTTENFSTPLTIPGTWQNHRRGTFVQKFSTLTEGPHRFRLQGKLMPDHGNSVFKNDFQAGAGLTSFVYGSDMRVAVKNFNVFEVLVSENN